MDVSRVQKILNQNIVIVETIREGFVGNVSKIVTDQNESYVVKEYLFPTSSGDIDREWQGLEFLYNNGIRVPKPMYFIDEKYILMEFINGRKLIDILAEEDTKEYHMRFATILYDIHKISVDELINAINLKTTDEFVIGFLKYLKSKLSKEQLDKYQYIFDWLNTEKEYIQQVPVSMLHMDYHPGNILVRNNQFYVIDIVHRIGDFRYDVFWTYNMMRRFGATDIADNFVRNYLNKLNLPQFDDSEFFNVLTEFSYLVTCLTTPSKNPEEVTEEDRKFWETIMLKSEQYINKFVNEKGNIL